MSEKQTTVPGSVTFKPVQRDMEAIEGLKQRHPFLVSIADVLRYCLHVVHHKEVSDGRVAAIVGRDDIVAAVIDVLDDEPTLTEDEIDMAELPPDEFRDKLKARLDAAYRRDKKEK